MTTIRESLIQRKLKTMQTYKRNCERAGRPYSGYLGVYYCSTSHRYRVYIGNKGTYRKSFDSAKEAALWYDNHVVKINIDAITNKELGLL